tara:strand:+ start:52 stop:270 length:219 start_codon:yes stop_codon:yes gene_type:complete
MAYERQVQQHLDALDVQLNKLYLLIKKGNQSEALKFMEDGPLKEAYEELQSIIKLSSTNHLGARGVQNIRPL